MNEKNKEFSTQHSSLGIRTPAIRFKGFSEDWLVKTLGEVTDVYDGTHQTPLYTNSGVMFLSVENIKTLQSEKYISQKSFEKEFKVFPKKQDVLMTRIGDIGTANVVESDVPKAYYVTLALLKYKDLNPYFLKGIISSKSVKKDIWHRTLHIAFPKKINKNEITKVVIPHPKSEKEQTKIGSYFQQLDTLITQHQQKHDKLLNVKKAMLEKMFPKKGAEIPEIRFKGFSEKWEERKLGEVYNFQYGQFNVNPSDGGIHPVYGANGIIGGYSNFNAEDSVVIGHMGEYAGSVLWGEGKHFVTYNGTISTPKSTSINSQYGYYILYKLNIRKICGGSGQPFLSYETLQKLAGVFPISTTEQIKIADFFKSLDTLLSLHQTELEKLKNIKKACLEKMFV